MTHGGWRRLLHASSALVLLLVPLAGWLGLAAVVSAGVVLGWVLEVMRLRSARLRAFFDRRVPLFRDGESRRPSGAAWLGVGYLIAVWLPAPAPTAAVLVAALADPTASLIGSRFAAPPPHGGKTVAGSLAHLLVACVVLALLGHALRVALAVALLATAAERWSAPLDDNVVVPPLVGFAVVLLT